MGGAGASGETVTLWRPTGQAELDLVAAARWRAWPPRLTGQRIFYPVARGTFHSRVILVAYQRLSLAEFNAKTPERLARLSAARGSGQGTSGGPSKRVT